MLHGDLSTDASGAHLSSPCADARVSLQVIMAATPQAPPQGYYNASLSGAIAGCSNSSLALPYLTMGESRKASFCPRLPIDPAAYVPDLQWHRGSCRQASLPAAT